MYFFVDEKESEAEGLSKLYCAKVTAGRRSKYSQRMLLMMMMMPVVMMMMLLLLVMNMMIVVMIDILPSHAIWAISPLSLSAKCYVLLRSEKILSDTQKRRFFPWVLPNSYNDDAVKANQFVLPRL